MGTNMIPQLITGLKKEQTEVRKLAEWLDKYAAAESDVNHRLHNAQRAAWASVRTLGEAVRELEPMKGESDGQD